MKIKRKCPDCNQIVEEVDKFCSQCGASLARKQEAHYTPRHLIEKVLHSRSAVEGELKQVTIMFVDIKGSMSLSQQVELEDWHLIMNGFFALVGDAVHRFEGTVNQYTGDGIMGIFGAPIAHEDHAQRACYAALNMQQQLKQYSEELKVKFDIDFGVRIAMNSGDVVVGRIGDDLRMDYTAQGHTVGVAQRLEQQTPPGHISISDYTMRLAGPYFEFRAYEDVAVIEGRKTLYHALIGPSSVRSRFEVSRSRGFSGFVGRTDEYRTITDLCLSAKANRGRVLGICGEPGVGKSRLCDEFIRDQRGTGVNVYEAHCVSQGLNIPFVPVLQLFRAIFGIMHSDKETIALAKVESKISELELEIPINVLLEFLGIGPTDSSTQAMDSEVRQQRLIDILSKIIESDANGNGCIIFIDDMQWIDSWSGSLLEKLMQDVDRLPLFVLMTYRPEYEGSWLNLSWCHQIKLLPLLDVDVSRIVVGKVGKHASLHDLTAQIVRLASGNPLFAEESINMLTETKQLVGVRGDYTLATDTSELKVPPNVETIITSRIDRLDDDKKQVLQSAAVIGIKFPRTLLQQVCGISVSQLGQALSRLRDLDFIDEVSSYPQIELCFKHPLVHEMAYKTQLRARRVDLHERVAIALENLEKDRVGEISPTLAFHWDQTENLERALHWQRQAGVETQTHNPRASISHWSRVRELVGDGNTVEELSLAAEACESLVTLGWRMGGTEAETLEIFVDGKDKAERAGDKTLLAMLCGAYSAYRGTTLGDAEGYVHHAEEARSIAQVTRNEVLIESMLPWCVAAYFFNAKFKEGLNVCYSDLHTLQTPEEATIEFLHMPARGIVQICAGFCAGHLGRYDEAISLIRKGRPHAEHVPDPAAFAGGFESYFQAITGNAGLSVTIAERTLKAAEESGSNFARTAAMSTAGATSYLLGRRDEAEHLLSGCLEIIDSEQSGASQRSIVIGNLANLLLDRGESDRARELAEECIEFCEPRGLFWNLDPWISLARSCIVLGDRDGALATLHQLECLADRNGAALFRPLLELQRANFAMTFESNWNAENRISVAFKNCNELGAIGLRDFIVK